MPEENNPFRELQRAIIYDLFTHLIVEPLSVEDMADEEIDYFFSQYEVKVLFCDSEVVCIGENKGHVRAFESYARPYIGSYEKEGRLYFLLPLIWKVEYEAGNTRRALICFDSYKSRQERSFTSSSEKVSFALFETRVLTGAIAQALIAKDICFLAQKRLVGNLRALSQGVQISINYRETMDRVVHTAFLTFIRERPSFFSFLPSIFPVQRKVYEQDLMMRFRFGTGINGKKIVYYCPELPNLLFTSFTKNLAARYIDSERYEQETVTLGYYYTELARRAVIENDFPQVFEEEQKEGEIFDDFASDALFTLALIRYKNLSGRFETIDVPVRPRVSLLK